MSKLFNLKEWLTVPDAAKHLSILFKEEVTEADVLRLALEKKLKLSIHILKSTPAKRAELLNKAELENYPKFDTPDITLVVRADEIQFLVGTLDLPMIESEQTIIEGKFRQLLGLPAQNENDAGSICVEDTGNLYQLQERFADLIYLNIPEDANLLDVQRASAMQGYIHARNFPSDAMLVVRINSLREFEQAVIGVTAVLDKPFATNERNTLLTIIAALCDYSDIKFQDRGAASQIAKLTDDIGASITDDTIRNVLSKIPNSLEIRKK